MSEGQQKPEQSGIPVLLLYLTIAAVGAYLDYLGGLRVEAAYGPQVSLVVFLAVFVGLVILAFPAAVMILGLRGSKASA